ncbi:hypothetical protein Acsp04_01070 [Actinomadura sp. NBRC 104425]|uniref:response regulator transcription factor n=1 Tax=Actinomadura sp. NBRC 104425 TaxID=3032204 RepID=UPI0024A39ADA|nr:response regulator transcription factor [Actinomadura sp. NBRC 104425]GLZ09871.1 hypothetical protein Acsp04_01070 [Actinomadura sp. NBRC 104425]
MPRCLIITNDFPPRRGGIETFVYELARRFPPGEVVVYTSDEAQARAFDSGLPFPVVRDRVRTLLPTPRVARNARAVARAYGCDRVWFGAAAPLGLLAGRLGLPSLVLSQYVEQSYAADLLHTGGGVGYLLKDRVGEVAEFVDALERVAAGGTVIDPEVVRRLLARRREPSPLDRLTERERQVLALMAEGRSNGAIARALVVSEAAVVKHVGSIFTKLDLHQTPDDHRRVLAVLTYLRGVRPGP